MNKTESERKLCEEEKEAIIEYLKGIDQSGFYPNFNADIEATGWVKIKYKNE